MTKTFYNQNKSLDLTKITTAKSTSPEQNCIGKQLGYDAIQTHII